MSVDELIAKIRELDADERREVRAALEAMDEAGAPRTLEDVWRLLDEGWCDAGGQSLSEGIDEALYGREP